MPIQLVVYYDIDNVLDAEVRLTCLYLPKSFFSKTDAIFTSLQCSEREI